MKRKRKKRGKKKAATKNRMANRSRTQPNAGATMPKASSSSMQSSSSSSAAKGGGGGEEVPRLDLCSYLPFDDLHYFWHLV